MLSHPEAEHQHATLSLSSITHKQRGENDLFLPSGGEKERDNIIPARVHVVSKVHKASQTSLT